MDISTWNQLDLEQKRAFILDYLRGLEIFGLEKRNEQLKQIFLVQNMEEPEIKSYIERVYQKIIINKELGTCKIKQ